MTCRDEFAPDCPSREESANFRSPGTHYIATDHTAPLAGVTYRPIAAMPALRAWQATYSWPFKITWAGKGGCPWFATMALLGIWARHPSVLAAIDPRYRLDYLLSSRDESANFRSPGTHYTATEHTAPLAGVPYRGTEGSNPGPSSAESANHRFLSSRQAIIDDGEKRRELERDEVHGHTPISTRRSPSHLVKISRAAPPRWSKSCQSAPCRNSARSLGSSPMMQANLVIASQKRRA